MMNRLDAGPTQACIWMSAGLLNYKLCDRRFDCEHCPLDAALRGAGPDAVCGDDARERSACRSGITFPQDRLYSAGHTWLQPLGRATTVRECFLNGDPQRWRFGLDGFANSLISCPRHVRWNAAPRVLQPGETLCALEFDGGFLTLGTPVIARLSGQNPALDDDPGAVLSAPYGAGWMVDLAAVDESELHRLLPAEAAREQARLDLRRLRRRIALHLLADENSVSPTLTDGGELLANPLRILGGARYLELVRELVH